MDLVETLALVFHRDGVEVVRHESGRLYLKMKGCPAEPADRAVSEILGDLVARRMLAMKGGA